MTKQALTAGFLVLLACLSAGCFSDRRGREAARQATASALQATFQAREKLTTTVQSITPTPTATPTLRITTHVVERGDTLLAIARQYGVTVDDLMDANNIRDPTSLRVGEELIIPLERRPRSTPRGPSPTETPTPEEVASAVPCISWQKAGRHIGEEKCVYGVIIGLHRNGEAEPLALTFDLDPKSFRVLISMKGNFDSWLGACLLILGKIEEDERGSYIVLKDLSQVQTCDHHPLPPP
ncbi:MAG: LysM peptidoglycan-binding domain-containing protein [Anaerolineae bacterium]